MSVIDNTKCYVFKKMSEKIVDNWDLIYIVKYDILDHPGL